MKIFTIIKDQSERVPDKNFRYLDGKPLWSWVLGELSSHEIYVNTDSKRLMDDPRVSDYGIHLIRRRQDHIDWEGESQTKGSPVEDMLADFYYEFVSNMDEPVALVHVTSPFLRDETLTNAAKFLQQGFRSVHSVRRIQDFCYVEQENHERAPTPINFDPGRVQRTQDLRPVFQSLGAFFITTKRNWLESGTRLPPPTKFYELNYPECVEIDVEEEFQLAERCASWT